MRNIDSTLGSGTHKRFVSSGFLIRKVAHRRRIFELFSNLLAQLAQNRQSGIGKSMP